MTCFEAKYLSESSLIKYVTVDLQLEGVATKNDLEGITYVDTSSFALFYLILFYLL